jgi:uncharacterized integral membrane protein
MLSIITLVLGLMIIVSAVAADRSSRTHRPFRAILLNLCGIACLAVGLISIFTWSHHRSDHRHMIAASSPSDSAVMVQLVTGSDGRLEPVTTSGDDSITAEKPTSSEGESFKAEFFGGDAARETEQRAEQLPAESDPPGEMIDLTEVELGSGELENGEDAGDDEAGSQIDARLTQVQIDYAARPNWVDQPDQDVGQIHQICVTAGPYPELRKARQELYNQLRTETDRYINEFVAHPHASRWIGYDADEIRQRFIAPDRIFDEQVVSPSFGDMHQSHALLEFGPAFHSEVQQAWHHVMARAQLVKVALAGGAIMGMLVLLFGYFNADTATRGFYSGRLKFVTALAILAVVATGVFIARSIPWLWL